MGRNLSPLYTMKVKIVATKIHHIDTSYSRDILSNTTVHYPAQTPDIFLNVLSFMLVEAHSVYLSYNRTCYFPSIHSLKPPNSTPGGFLPIHSLPTSYIYTHFTNPNSIYSFNMAPYIPHYTSLQPKYFKVILSTPLILDLSFSIHTIASSLHIKKAKREHME